MPRQSAALGPHRRLFADRRRNPDGKRDAVLQTAVRMFLERSYGRTSMNDVATQLNITKPALYHYFRNKEEILVEIYRLGTDLIDEMLDAIEAEEKPGLDKVADFISGYIRIVSGDFGRAVIRLDDGELSRTGRKTVRERKREIDHRLRAMIDGGIGDGSVAPCDAKIAAFIVAGAIHGMASWYEPSGPMKLAAITAQYVRILAAGLATGDMAAMAAREPLGLKRRSFRRLIEESMEAIAEREGTKAAFEKPLLLGKAAVLGAGTMGSRIAAHLANAGVSVLLLDLPGMDGARNAVADKAVDGLKKSKPAAFYTPAAAARIRTGNFEDDLAALAGCDWIVEAVTENLEIKQQLLARVAPHVQPHAFLTTNTSGIPVGSIASVLPSELRRRWFGTHFFNPPRYMRLVEVIPGPDTDPAAMAALSAFLDQNLGKEVVRARDTPNFIANRIGTFFILETLRVMEEEGLTVEEVDSLTGTAIGLPRTGTFRLADMVGLDILAHVARNFAKAKQDAGGQAALPPFLESMLERKWLGDKTGGGFYKKERGADGKDVRLVLDLKTLEYQPSSKPKLQSLEMAKNLESLPERLRMLLSGDQKKDKAARFHWKLLTRLWNYAADCLPEIADSAASIDAAMRAGYNWQLGPFEMWDAVGVADIVKRMQAASERVSPVVEAMLASGAELVPKQRCDLLRPGDEELPAGGARGGRGTHCGFPRQPRSRPQQSGSVAGGPGRRRGLDRAALEEERDR